MGKKEIEKSYFDFASGKEKSLIRIILLKLNMSHYDIVKASGIYFGPNGQYIYGFTQSDDNHDVVINCDMEPIDQAVTLIHELLHLMYPYAHEDEVEAAGKRLYSQLTPLQLENLNYILDITPIWIPNTPTNKLLGS